MFECSRECLSIAASRHEIHSRVISMCINIKVKLICQKSLGTHKIHKFKIQLHIHMMTNNQIAPAHRLCIAERVIYMHLYMLGYGYTGQPWFNII